MDSVADAQTLNAGQRRHLSIHEYQSVQLLNSVSLGSLELRVGVAAVLVHPTIECHE
jgi:hypothetical protein